MKMLLKTAACGLALAALPVPALAAQANPSAQQAATRIAFAPPLGRDIAFEYEATQTEDGETGSAGGSFTVTFAREGETYLATVTLGELGLPDEAGEMLGDMLELAKKPYVLILSPEGKVTGMKDADAYWEQAVDAGRKLFEGLSQAEGDEKDPGATRAALDMIESMRNLPSETRLALLTKDVAPIFELAGTQWTGTAPVVTEAEVPSPFGPIKRRTTSRLVTVANGVATIQSSATIPKEELERMTAAMFEQVSRSMDAEKAAEASALMKSGIFESFSHETDTTSEVAVDTGLLLSLKTEERIDVKAGGKSKSRVSRATIRQVR